jgi:16S rRNA processing protein RimM
MMPKPSSDFYELGYVSRTHGIKGHVIIKMDVDDPNRYNNMDVVYLGDSKIRYEIEKAEVRGDSAFVLFKGHYTLSSVEDLVGNTAFLPLGDLPELDDRSLYLHEAVDMEVVDQHLGSLGRVVKVYDLPHQPVAAVMINSKEVLIPLLRDFILKVDRAAQIIHMDLPEGLIGVYLNSADS